MLLGESQSSDVAEFLRIPSDFLFFLGVWMGTLKWDASKNVEDGTFPFPHFWVFVARLPSPVSAKYPDAHSHL
jgi:hypothetical protein